MDKHLGKWAVDHVTGFAGVITAVAKYLNGSERVMLEAVVEGKPFEAWFDGDRIELRE